MLMPSLSLPKNRSTGNLALSADNPVPADQSRYRMSFEGSGMDYDALARFAAASSLLTTQRSC